jgi:membrane protease YdiL (CAAX protease family)
VSNKSEEKRVAGAVYPNGMPHPPTALRLRVATELGVLVILTALFLIFVPQDPQTKQGMYFGMALVGLGLVGFTAKETEERIWGPVTSPPFDRVRRCAINTSFFTIPPALAFLVIGIAGRYFAFKPYEGACSMFSLHFLMALCIYLPWALLQQTLFQFYLLGRLRALLPFASALQISIINGVLYGLCHLPNPELTIVTIIGGIFWSYSYHRDRYVIPIAVSHAVLASTFFFWVMGRDIVHEFATK